MWLEFLFLVINEFFFYVIHMHKMFSNIMVEFCLETAVGVSQRFWPTVRVDWITFIFSSNTGNKMARAEIMS